MHDFTLKAADAETLQAALDAAGFSPGGAYGSGGAWGALSVVGDVYTLPAMGPDREPVSEPELLGAYAILRLWSGDPPAAIEPLLVEPLAAGPTWDGATDPEPVRAWFRARLRERVNARLEAVLSGGFVYDFGAPYGVQRLQTRNLDDRTNWLVSQAGYLQAVMAGLGAQAGASFRTEANVTISLTFDDALAVLNAMAQWGTAAMARSWALKDAIAAAPDMAALHAIDIAVGWP